MALNSDSKDQWIKAWKKEIGFLSRIYQCNANAEIWTQLKKNMNELEELTDKIANRMEREGTWRRGQ